MANSTRLFPNYYRMASKRLSSCKHLIGTSNCPPKYVLHDIYYLSGYILEGFCIYCIYKLYGWDENTAIDDYQGMTPQELNNFFSRTHLRFSNVKRSGQIYSIQGHNFQHYVDLLKYRPEFQTLPFFSTIDLDNDIKNLVDKWKPEVRYSYDSISLSVNNLNSMLEFCSNVQRVIINEIGYDYDED